MADKDAPEKDGSDTEKRKRKPGKTAARGAAPDPAPVRTAARGAATDPAPVRTAARGVAPDPAPVKTGARGAAPARNEKFDQYDIAYIDADTNYDADIRAAQGDAALIQRIDDNLAQLSGLWSRAKRLQLEANNAAIAAALAAAKDANKAVKDARASAAKIVSTVSKVDSVVGALASLTDELSKV